MKEISQPLKLSHTSFPAKYYFTLYQLVMYVLNTKELYILFEIVKERYFVNVKERLGSLDLMCFPKTKNLSQERSSNN